MPKFAFIKTTLIAGNATGNLCRVAIGLTQKFPLFSEK
jgi:hypothetical protein